MRDLPGSKEVMMDNARKREDQSETGGAALTRREWLLSLGSAVVLSGFRGVPMETEPSAQASRVPLPPGLYQPSLDHLSHALSSEGLFVSVPPGAETEYARPRPGHFVPQAFAPNDYAIVRRLAEIILGEDLKNAAEKPTSGGPASIYEEVAEWIDLMVASAPGTRALARNLSPDQRVLGVAFFGSEEPVSYLESFEPDKVCREGLAWVAEESQRRFARGFLNLDARAQAELVQAISDARPDRSTTHAGTRLFRFLKEETIRGFYTSRVGLKELDSQRNSLTASRPAAISTLGTSWGQERSVWGWSRSC